jgi:outer membrane protein TolC
MPSVCFGESPQIIEIGDTRGKNFLGGLEAEPAPSFLTAKISASSKQSSGYYTSDGSRQNTAMGVSLNHGETFDSFDFGGRKSTFARSTSDWRKTRATDEPKHIELIEEVPDLVPAVDVKYTQL